jgi:hypothetical protein
MAVRLDHDIFAWVSDHALALDRCRSRLLPVQIVQLDFRFPVAMAEGKHPFPSRTRPLSPPAPMVLHGRHVGE